MYASSCMAGRGGWMGMHFGSRLCSVNRRVCLYFRSFRLVLSSSACSQEARGAEKRQRGKDFLASEPSIEESWYAIGREA